jgi:CRISPR system Cascade subunit CasD
MDCLILRFDAPLMSFGAVVVDQINPVWRFPGRSMLAGLLGNALGWDHRDVDRLQHLQERLRFAARWDAEPVPFTDYQTVELGQPFMVDTGWTTRGRREDRKGGSAATGTHQRWRDFWANGVATVAIALDGEDSPTLDDLERALQRPARPLFIGRKPCLPAPSSSDDARPMGSRTRLSTSNGRTLARAGNRRDFGRCGPSMKIRGEARAWRSSLIAGTG